MHRWWLPRLHSIELQRMPRWQRRAMLPRDHLAASHRPCSVVTPTTVALPQSHNVVSSVDQPPPTSTVRKRLHPPVVWKEVPHTAVRASVRRDPDHEKREEEPPLTPFNVSGGWPLRPPPLPTASHHNHVIARRRCSTPLQSAAPAPPSVLPPAMLVPFPSQRHQRSRLKDHRCTQCR